MCQRKRDYDRLTMVLRSHRFAQHHNTGGTKRVFVLLGLLWLCLVTAARCPIDSIFGKLNFFIVPTASYAPDTNWAFGVAGAYFFNCKDQPRTSDMSLNTNYTLNHQFSFSVTSNIYFAASKRWMIYSKIKFRHYPYYFYGIGNTAERMLPQRMLYTSNCIQLKAQPQYYLTDHWLIGAAIHFRWEQTFDTDSLVDLTDPVRGFGKYLMFGLGTVISYDTRNNINYPNGGIFFKSTVLYYEPLLGSSYRSGNITTDFRHFISIYKQLIFAWQFTTEWTLGHAQPFQLLPTLGGTDLLRGVINGQWRDEAMMALQAELRIPIWHFIKGTVFGGIGDVYNLRDWLWATPKIGYGAGLRLTFNKANVNLRFDIARKNLNTTGRERDAWNYYITIKEAF